MRTFFAIDQKSSLRLSTLRRLLALSLSHKQYEVMTLEEDRFLSPRTNLKGLFSQARFEASKVYQHYHDTRLCVVVFGFQTCVVGHPDRAAFFDYSIQVHKNGSYEWRLLNPPLDSRNPNIYWASSPALQPELAETLLETTDLPMTS